MEIANESAFEATQAEHLSARALRQLLTWSTELCLAQSRYELERVCHALHEALPIRSMAIAYGKLNTRREVELVSEVHNISYPEGWISLYAADGFQRCDPVLQHAPTDRRAKLWPALLAAAKEPQQLRFVEAAADHGLTHGVTYCHYSPRDGEACFLSVAGTPALLADDKRAILDLLAPHLHQAALRVRERAPDGSVGGLSAREQDIMRWMKLGKTNWEIAMILGISERTAKFHVSNIIRKLAANNRAHAIALALKPGSAPGVPAS